MKTKLVVINENMLGYIHPAQPKTAFILKVSIAKGAEPRDSYPLGSSDNVRLASEEDFNSFGVIFKGFKAYAHAYEFAT